MLSVADDVQGMLLRDLKRIAPLDIMKGKTPIPAAHHPGRRPARRPAKGARPVTL
jgi:hypothetical protein